MVKVVEFHKVVMTMRNTEYDESMAVTEEAIVAQQQFNERVYSVVMWGENAFLTRKEMATLLYEIADDIDTD